MEAVASAENALELDGVAKLYGHTIALRPVSLSVRVGSVLAVLGPNGSGKTTLLKIIAGVIAPSTGDGRVFGLDLCSQRAELRSKIGFLGPETYLYDDLTARENLRFISTMAGQRQPEDRIEDVLNRVGLAGAGSSLSPPPRHDAQSVRVRAFSSGMKRRLALARLILLQPALWLLDEPYTSLDESAADTVDGLIRDVVNSGGAVVMATHDAARAAVLSDAVAELDRGRLTYLGPAAAFSRADVQHVV